MKMNNSIWFQKVITTDLSQENFNFIPIDTQLKLIKKSISVTSNNTLHYIIDTLQQHPNVYANNPELQNDHYLT
jgi:hypothetical protein